MRSALAAVATAAVLGGCATFEKQRGHDQVASVVKDRIGADTGWGEGAPEAEEIAARVEALLEDGLTADRAVAIALVNNPGLQGTYEELGVSQADMIQAGLLTNPSLSMSFGIPRTPGAIVEMEFSIVQEFIDLFMLPLKKKVAEEQFLADTLRVAHEALATAADVKKDLVELQTVQELLAMQRRSLTTLEAARDLARKQHRAGNITDLELKAREVEYEQARVEVSQSELSVTALRERLNRALGLWGPRTQWRLAERLAELPPEEPRLEHLETLAIRQRLDLAAARRQVALMKTAADLARTWRWVGRVEVGAHTHQDPNGPHLIGPDLTLELPIFDQRQALIARLESQRRQSERHLTALSVNTRSEVREGQARLLTARNVVAHLKTHVLPLREQVVEQSLLQYNAMQIGLYALLEAKRAQLDSTRAYLEALRDYWAASIELERLVGGRLGPTKKPASTPTPNPDSHTAPEKEQHHDQRHP